MSEFSAELTCRYCGRPAAITLLFLKHDAVNVRTLLTVQTHEWSISIPGVLVGWNLREFLSRLPGVANGERKSTRLVSLDEEIQLDFKRLNAFQPTVVVSGKLNQPLPFVEADGGSVSGVREGHPPGEAGLVGVEADFGGLLTTVSDLQAFAQGLRLFLQETRLSTSNPWSPSEVVE